MLHVSCNRGIIELQMSSLVFAYSDSCGDYAHCVITEVFMFYMMELAQSMALQCRSNKHI